MRPEDDPHNEACKVPVYSTSGAVDGSDTARVIRDALRKCPHERDADGEDSPAPDSAARLAGGTLADVARLIDAADSLLAKEVALREVGEIIEAALDQIEEDADADTREIEGVAWELERLASIEDARGLAAASQAGAADPWPPGDGARELVGLAEARLTDADDLIPMAAGTEEQQELTFERDRLALRIERLSTQLKRDR
jgi:hypothetical protein